MKVIGPSALAGGLSLALFLTACSGGDSGSSGAGGSSTGSMFVQTCSLGCSSGSGGLQVSCSIVETFVNKEITVLFSQPVDPDTLSSSTFKVIDVNSGQVPVGTRFVDPSNSRRVVFRPSVIFDSLGNPAFGFTADTTYRVTIPGLAQNDNGPFIKSLGGKSNGSRMQCDIRTSQGIVDPVPGSPVVSIKVDIAIPSSPNPNDFIPNQEANNALNVWRNSTIRFHFNDIMNPVTLANPVTHQAAFASVKVDEDGNPSTTGDQSLWPGQYSVDLDLDTLTTVMTFTSPLGMPSAGGAGLRKMVLSLPAGMQDLASNPLGNAGTYFFTPETVPYPAVVLPDADGESFTDTINCDVPNTSADWSTGRLKRGYGGGSGRLGALRVRTGQTVTLNTDGTTFPISIGGIATPRDLLDNSCPMGSAFPGTCPGPAYTSSNPSSWPAITITDGIFEFTSLTVEPGATLVITGNQPARVFSRGACTIVGMIDIRGSSPPVFNSSTAMGETGGAGGPNGGDGGDGADRTDNTGSTGSTGLLATPTGGVPIGSASNPAGWTSGIVNPGSDPNGQPGEGVGQVPGGRGAASGGLHFPVVFPSATSTVGPTLGDITFSDDGGGGCESKQVCNPGGGAGYATAGTSGQPATKLNLVSDGGNNLPPLVAGDFNGDGGDAIALEPSDPESGHTVRKLQADLGNLRGGGGGGGGGSSLFDSKTNGALGNCVGMNSPIIRFFDHSGGGGGGGGGALQLVSGKTLSLSGFIRAQGGNGGSASTTPLVNPPPPAPAVTDPNRGLRAAPGGGGSGGAVRLQGLVLTIDGNVPPDGSNGRVNVTGGAGGVTDLCDGPATPVCLNRGGRGGTGLIRLEDTTLGVISRASEAPKLSPFDVNDLNMMSGLPESDDFLSVGLWDLPRKRPESFTGAVSCWMKPSGNFFLLEFKADVYDTPNPPHVLVTAGWNMQIAYDDTAFGGTFGPRNINYRGPDPNAHPPAFPGGATDFEGFLLDNLNHGLPANQRSYLSVRFQGAKATGDITAHPCDVELTGANSQISPGSLTPWVRHPADLNGFVPRPNMVRFTVVFDKQQETSSGIVRSIQGVTNLKINCQPD